MMRTSQNRNAGNGGANGGNRGNWRAEEQPGTTCQPKRAQRPEGWTDSMCLTLVSLSPRLQLQFYHVPGPVRIMHWGKWGQTEYYKVEY